MGSKHAEERKPSKPKTPTFLLELPLEVQAGQAARVGAHLEVGRQFYNAVLSKGQLCLRRMRADPEQTRPRPGGPCHPPAPRSRSGKPPFQPCGSATAFLSTPFTNWRKGCASLFWPSTWMRCWPHAPQTLASRAYRALNRVCVGKAKRVRFKSKSRGLDSIENKRNDTGLRFVLEPGAAGCPQGYLLWHDDHLPALIDWDDPVVAHGLAHEIKYARLVRRRASSPRAQGADRQGFRYCVQLVLKGLPHHKPKHTTGTDTIGLDLGPQSLAIVPR